jgi:hypothetical protein
VLVWAPFDGELSTKKLDDSGELTTWLSCVGSWAGRGLSSWPDLFDLRDDLDCLLVCDLFDAEDSEPFLVLAVDILIKF